MSYLTVVMLTGMVSVLAITWLFWWHFHERAVLRKWAAAKGYQILEFKRCLLAGGFSAWETSSKQIVFFIRVRDDSRQERSGWVRFGTQISPLDYSNREPDVIWTEPGSKQS